MTEPTITCPNCKTEIRLTESLAAPLLAATRKDFELRLATKEQEVATRELGIREKVLVAVLAETDRLNTFSFFLNQTFPIAFI